MNILDLDRKELEKLVESGLMRPENLKHYDVCKQLAEGKKQNAIAEAMNIPDVRLVRYIKGKKCSECR